MNSKKKASRSKGTFRSRGRVGDMSPLDVENKIEWTDIPLRDPSNETTLHVPGTSGSSIPQQTGSRKWKPTEIENCGSGFPIQVKLLPKAGEKSEETSFIFTSEKPKGESRDKLVKVKGHGESFPFYGSTSHKTFTESVNSNGIELATNTDDAANQRAWRAIEKIAVNTKFDVSRFQSPETFWTKQFSSDTSKWQIPSFPPKDEIVQNLQNEVLQAPESSEDQETSEETIDSSNLKPRRKSRESIFRFGEGQGLPKIKFNFTGKRKVPDEDVGKGAEGNWILAKISDVETEAKKGKVLRSFDGSKGIMPLFRRLRGNRMAKRRQIVQRRTYPATVFPAICAPTYVHVLFDWLYYSCLSPYKHNKKSRANQTLREFMFDVLQKIIFTIFSTLMTYHILMNNIKKHLLIFIDRRKPVNLFDISFFLSVLFIQSFYIYFVTFCQDEITRILKLWEFCEACTSKPADMENISKQTRKKYCRVIALGIGSTLFTIFSHILYRGFESWDFWTMFRQYGACFTFGRITWNPAATKNESVHKYYDDFDDDDYTGIHFLGLVQLLMQIVSDLVIDAVRNLVIFVSLVNDDHVGRFGNMAKNCVISTLPFFNDIKKDLRCWAQYRLTKKVNKSTNKTFGGMLKLVHLNNLLLFTFLLTLFFSKKSTILDIFFISYQIGKAVYAYWVARDTVSHNETTQEWITTLADETRRFVVGNIPFNKLLMLFELKMHPFGLGTGQFLIDDMFLYKMAGASASILVLLLTFQYVP